MNNLKTDYKENTIYFFGSSDIAALIVYGKQGKEFKAHVLEMGKDGNYKAYKITEEYAIPDHYKLDIEFDDIAIFYDDEGIFSKISAEKIKIYRAGQMGLLIQTINAR